MTHEMFDNCKHFCGASSDCGALAQASRDEFNRSVGDLNDSEGSCPKRRRTEPKRFSSEITTKTRSLGNEELRLVKELAAALAAERVQAEEIEAGRLVNEQLTVAAAATEV